MPLKLNQEPENRRREMCRKKRLHVFEFFFEQLLRPKFPALFTHDIGRKWTVTAGIYMIYRL